MISLTIVQRNRKKNAHNELKIAKITIRITCFVYIQSKISKELVEKLHKVSGINLRNDMGKLLFTFHFTSYFFLSFCQEE